jgi:hypothetical protein
MRPSCGALWWRSKCLKGFAMCCRGGTFLGKLIGTRNALVSFIEALIIGLAVCLTGFAGTWLYFSDPVGDSSFRSKVVLCGIALVLATVLNGLMLADLVKYFHLWRGIGFHAIVQV